MFINSYRLVQAMHTQLNTQIADHNTLLALLLLRFCLIKLCRVTEEDETNAIAKISHSTLLTVATMAWHTKEHLNSIRWLLSISTVDEHRINSFAQNLAQYFASAFSAVRLVNRPKETCFYRTTSPFRSYKRPTR